VLSDGAHHDHQPAPMETAHMMLRPVTIE
jgi:hypothetical protein